MIEKFNFYDIYGYLIPGFVLIGLVSLPFGIVYRAWPTIDISSAVLLLLLAYILGHIIQNLALGLMPSKIQDKEDNSRHPSDLVVDGGDGTFTAPTKEKIGQLSKRYFQIEIHEQQDLARLLKQVRQERDAFEEASAPERALIEEQQRELAGKEALLSTGDFQRAKSELDSREAAIERSDAALKAREQEIRATIQNRDEAFFLARSALLRDKKSSYWEQFEGLYALMRGTTAAASVASAYAFGWALSLLCMGFSVPENAYRKPAAILAIALLLLFVLFILRFSIRPARTPHVYRAAATAAEKRERELIDLWAFRVSVLAAGTLLGVLTPCFAGQWLEASKLDAGARGSVALILLLIALTIAIAAIRAFGAYKAFAKEFAVAVWRDFANIEAQWSRPEDKWSPQSAEISSPAGEQD